MSKLIKWLIPIGVILLAAIWIISSSNSMTRANNDVQEQLSNVATQLQRRADLVPNLVKSVQADQAQEQTITKSITDARAGVTSAKTTDEKVDALNKEAAAINSGINVIVENYPNLQSSQSVRDLMVQLEGTENRIATERRNYNGVAKTYNNKVTVFPGSVIASITGHSKVKYFEESSGSQEVPQVNFSTSSSN